MKKIIFKKKLMRANKKCKLKNSKNLNVNKNNNSCEIGEELSYSIHFIQLKKRFAVSLTI